MAKTAVKRPAASMPRPSVKPGAKSKPFLRFHHDYELRTRTLAVLLTLEQSPDPAKHRVALAEVVVELTDTGMDCYFMQPLKLSGAGFVLQQSANLGMAGVLKVIGPVIRGIIGRMDEPQLLSVCGSIRQFMR